MDTEPKAADVFFRKARLLVLIILLFIGVYTILPKPSAMSTVPNRLGVLRGENVIPLGIPPLAKARQAAMDHGPDAAIHASKYFCVATRRTLKPVCRRKLDDRKSSRYAPVPWTLRGLIRTG